MFHDYPKLVKEVQQAHKERLDLPNGELKRRRRWTYRPNTALISDAANEKVRKRTLASSMRNSN